MKKIYIFPMIIILFSLTIALFGCATDLTVNRETVQAAVATLTEEELDAFCETIEFYTADGFLRELTKTYTEGKSAGVIWIRVNHNPNQPDLEYMVELVDYRCKNR